MFDFGYNSYQQTEIEAKASGASPAELVLMLMDGLIDEIDRIHGHILNKNYEQKGQSIKKCIKILSGLSVALDLQSGGQLALNLHQVYQYCRKRLLKVSIRNDMTELENVRKIILELHEGWQGFAKRNS